MRKILRIILLLVLLTGGYFGYKYYDDTYRTEVAYALVPLKVPEKTETRDSSGKVVDNTFSYEYNFMFVKENGEKQEMSYDVSGSNPIPFEPGSYVKADISKKRVVHGPNGVKKTKIPKTVIKELTE